MLDRGLGQLVQDVEWVCGQGFLTSTATTHSLVHVHVQPAPQMLVHAQSLCDNSMHRMMPSKLVQYQTSQVSCTNYCIWVQSGLHPMHHNPKKLDWLVTKNTVSSPCIPEQQHQLAYDINLPHTTKCCKLVCARTDDRLCYGSCGIQLEHRAFFNDVWCQWRIMSPKLSLAWNICIKGESFTGVSPGLHCFHLTKLGF